MKLDLTKFDKYVNDRGINPSNFSETFLVDASTFNPRNLKRNDQRARPAGNMNGGQNFSNGCDEADVIADKGIESVINHIGDRQNVDNLKEDMGTRLKHIFEANDKDGATIFNELQCNENWVEFLGEKLRPLKNILAADIRKLMGSSQADGNWEALTESLSRDWGADISTVVGLSLLMTANTAFNWLCSKFKEAGQIVIGPIAEQFFEKDFTETASEAFGVDE